MRARHASPRRGTPSFHVTIALGAARVPLVLKQKIDVDSSNFNFSYVH
jgi:hypothetical protein